MISESITFECLTPCFCAGADQSKAEIRPSAIRGALRWWFRALGGTNEQERLVFGGSEPVTASALRIRVKELSPSLMKEMPRPAQNTPLSYILFFPSIAGGDSAKFGQGPRWNTESCLGPGTSFTLELQQIRSLPNEYEDLVTNVLKAFAHFGSIGMHSTRGLGAVQARGLTLESHIAAEELLKSADFTIRKSERGNRDWIGAVDEIGQILRDNLRQEWGAGGNQKPPQATGLGSAPLSERKLAQNRWKQVPRQTSAVYLRPFKASDGKLYVIAFEAPHMRVLGEESRQKHKEPILASRDFSHPLPTPPQGKGNHGHRR